MSETQPKQATVIHWGRALNQPRKGQKVVIMASAEAPQDRPPEVTKGDPWRLVAWVRDIPAGALGAFTLPVMRQCWIPAEWLDHE